VKIMRYLYDTRDAYLSVANMTLKDDQMSHEERTVMAAIRVIQTLPYLNVIPDQYNFSFSFFFLCVCYLFN
jgi:hypothetical protein